MRSEAPHQHWLPDIPSVWTNALGTALLRINPVARHLRLLSTLLPNMPSTSVVLRDAPAAEEIAAIIRLDNSAAQDLGPRSLVISPRSAQRFMTIKSTDRFWEPIVYPLFFPHGNLGWGVVGRRGAEDDQAAAVNEQLQDADIASKQIWYYRRRLLSDPRFHIFGRLTNEYIIDMFSRNLETRLHYIRSNQERLRREDAELMEAGPDGQPVAASENIYLPASFLGSRRWASEQVRI